MASVPSYDDLREAGRQEILRKPTRFDPEIVDTEGSDVEIVVSVGASMASEATGFVQQGLNELSLSTAAKSGGEVLERFVWDRYQLVRQDAGQAVVPIRIDRTTTSAAASVPAETKIATADGVIFTTVNEVVFSVGQTGPLYVDSFAEVAGPLGNVAINTITVAITRLDDSTFAFSNEEPAAGGLNEETDDALADRARDFFVNARRGTRAAIQTGCVSTPGVAQATVLEDLDPDGNPLFRLQAIIADANGQANGALAAAVIDNLDGFRALGVPVRVIAGTPQFVDIVIENISFITGANTSTLLGQLRSGVVTAINNLSPGVTLERSLIIGALKINNSVLVPDNAVTTPTGDLVPSTVSGVIRTTQARVSINGQIGSVL
jgi:hypothetical protein